MKEMRDGYCCNLHELSHDGALHAPGGWLSLRDVGLAAPVPPLRGKLVGGPR